VEPTREQKLKTIKLANRLAFNMLQELAPDIQNFSENADYLAGIFKPTSTPRPAEPRPEPIETPAERARLVALMAEVQNPKEKK
jgi:hypothetical protein